MADTGPDLAEGSADLSPDEAFSILGNGTRMTILRTLWDADDALAFSELRERVEYDDPGNFNYHLDKLVGHFVARTPDGYALREAGTQVIRAVLAGAINRDPTLGPVELESRCPYCGASVELGYADEHLTVRCTQCPGIGESELPRGTYMHYGFPPAGLEGRTPEETLEAAHTLYDAKVMPMMEGVCPECAGRTTVSVEACDDHATGDRGTCERCGSRHATWAEYRCERCGYTRQCIGWFEVLNHPAVVAFYHDHGLEEPVPFSKLTWRNTPYIDDITETVLRDDPLRIRIAIPIDDEELRVTVDGAVNVVDVVRESRES